MSQRRRLDQEMTRRGLVTSRTQATELITQGRVLVAGSPTDRPSRLVSPAEPITITGDAPQFVGRGGEKLAAALEQWPDVRRAIEGSHAVDCGASTGGFTDCLLQNGAVRVDAVDVGHGQLHEKLRSDARVAVWERTDIRSVNTTNIGGPADVLVADLSFISLRTVAPALVSLCKPRGLMVLLVKPQFEVGRQAASRSKGVIVDDELRERSLNAVIDVLLELGCAGPRAFECPVHGAEGNREFLLTVNAPQGSQ